MSLLLALWIAALQPAAPAEGVNALVDRLSTRIDARIVGDSSGDAVRPPAPAGTEGPRAVVVSAAMEAPGDAQLDRLSVRVRQPGAGPRLMLVDAGAVFRAANGADYVPVPNQRFVLTRPEQVLTLEALPLQPDAPRPEPGTPLSVVWTNDPGVLAVLRAAQRLEAVEAPTLTRYLIESPRGVFAVKGRVDNRDARMAGWMAWSRNAADVVEGRYPRDALRFALWAVTARWTIDEVVHWLRTVRRIDLEPAMKAGWVFAHQTEYLLERAGLNHRVFSPNHADYHFNRGVDAYLRADLKAASAAFIKAEQALPGFGAAKYNEGVVYYRAGNYQDAATAFLVAGGMRDATADVHYNRGATQFRLGNTRSAAISFRKALALNPKDPEAATWLATADPDNLTAPKKKKKKRRRRRRRKTRRRRK